MNSGTSFDHHPLLQELRCNGVVQLPNLLSPQRLMSMQQAFCQRLRMHSFNTWRGYEQNERWRRLVEDCLALDRGFVDLALHPLVHKVLDEYFQHDYVLTEARGWETVATRRNFHGWHNDAWYDSDLAQVPKQIKLGVYLSSAASGQFRYLQGSHLKNLRHGHWSDAQVAELAHPILDMYGEAGTAFLFDTSGIHRQASPVLKPRHVVFFNFHDPATPLLSDETAYGRYQAPMLKVSMLPLLSERQQSLLGIGRESANSELPIQHRRFRGLHRYISILLKLRLLLRDAQDQGLRIYHGLRRRIVS
ncbi:MAG: phytanoyl-CoA dioxygenase family protein [Oceanococcus sp.]